ncbi:MAG: hypothetical protein IPK80_02910 [Nannocystis sp.]|nr:hypothetical protein [Nannocystis sp.]
MTIGNVRWSVDPRATKRIRFDDTDFQDALIGDASREGTPLAKLLEAEAATDGDFTAFIADGVYLDARLGITAGEDDQLQNHAQQDDARKGVKVDIDRYNRAWFATWVLGVGTDDTEATGAIPPGLSAGRKSDREAAIGSLPTPVRAVLFARLRAHVDDVSRPALRDPLRSQKTGAEA